MVITIQTNMYCNDAHRRMQTCYSHIDFYVMRIDQSPHAIWERMVSVVLTGLRRDSMEADGTGRHHFPARLASANHQRSETLLGATIDAAISVTEADFGTIQLLDRASGELRIVVQRDLPDWWVDFWTLVPDGCGSCGTAWARGERVIVEDVELIPLFIGSEALDIQCRAGVRSEQSTPIMSRSGQRLGLFSTYSRVPGPLDVRCLRLLDLLALQAAEIIEREYFEQELERSEQRYRTLVMKTAAVTWSCPPSGLHVEPQKSWMDFTGQSARQMLGAGWSDAVHPDDAAAVSACWSVAVAQGQPFSSEHRNRRHDGEWRWMQVDATPILDADGRILEWFGMCLDTTERKEQEVALRASEQRYRRLLESMRDAFVVVGMDGGIQDFNAAYCEMLGYSSSELRQMTYVDLTPAAWHAMEAKIVDEEILPTGSSGVYEKEYRRKNGEVFPIELRTYLVCDDAGQPHQMWAMIRDVSARRRANDALRESEERFRTLGDHMDQLAWMADRHGSIFWYNRRWLDYTGTTLEQMLSQGWTSAHHPDHVHRVVERMQHGSRTGELWEDTFPLRDRDGDYRWFLSRAVPILDETGQVLRWLGTNTDITERRALEEALLQADRRKDEFLALLSHELRNPLAPIRHAAALACLPDISRSQLNWACQLIGRQVQHMSRLLDDLLDVSRITRGKLFLDKRRVAIAEVVRTAVETTGPLLTTRQHTLRIDIPEEAPEVDGDPLRLAQVVCNLLTNAAKYTDPGGSVRIAAQAQQGWVEISVEDTGSGIAPEHLERVFEMFTQVPHASRQPDGLGIGLALARGLAQMHGGSVHAFSEGRGKGSRFVVRLPALQPTAEGSASATKPVTGPLEKRRVLIVDDNADAADALGALLRAKGHDVKIAYEAQHGLSIAGAWNPDVALLDLKMPGMDGFELARRLRDLPQVHRLTLAAISGWGQQHDREKALKSGFDFHMTKPVAEDAIDGVLHRAG